MSLSLMNNEKKCISSNNKIQEIDLRERDQQPHSAKLH